MAEFEIGVALPSAGAHASRDAVVQVAQAAEELGLDSAWVPEHLLVSPAAGEGYGRVLDPFAVLAYLAAGTERLRLGTSVALLPLHHPVHMAKQAATLQELSGGRFRLGIGVGWHAPEFDMLGVDFHDRGRRADEALRLIKALWAGERSFHGRYWSFEDGYFGPLPDPTPEIWIGGTSERSIRRAREHGDVWHPNDTDPALLRRAKELWPDGRIVPRAGPALLEGDPRANVERLREAGADGVVVRFGAEPDEMVENMRRFVEELRPAP